MYPSKDEFIKLSETFNLIPVYQDVSADMATPIGVFSILGTHEYCFFLESVEGGERWGRYSFMGLDPMLIFKSHGTDVEIQSEKKTDRFTVEDPIRTLEDRLRHYRSARISGLPRFFGGAVGYIGYETVSFFEPIADTLPDPLRLPDTWFMIPRLVLAFDNLKHVLKVVANAYVPAGTPPGIVYDRAVGRVNDVLKRLSEPIPLFRPSAQTSVPVRIISRIAPDQFESMVTKAKEYIRQGEIIQVVLSQGFETETSADPFDVYRVLRRINPSPYLFYLKFGRTAVLGSSPEVMVRLEADRVTLRPIAGTRPRGQNEEEDKRLESDLLADPKERAEHVMLVDLARNDVGRVAVFDTVKLTDLMVIERYSHVMHIVSNVEARLRDGFSAFDVLRATFPAGTVSGAPKVRAMEIIHELEPYRRGPYSGAVGYFSFDGNMDLAITIRTIVFKDGKAFVQAGAGIVADSVPKKEYDETVHKATALFEAIRTMGA
ncbi:MAG: anthranilate synthase component I [Deltaproteobacteria bacterium]|nr:anthranilate synthase component I [Deltaproteobacteria bacterium]